MNYILKISGTGNRFLLIDKRWFSRNTAPDGWLSYSRSSSLNFEDFTHLSTTNTSHRKKIIAHLTSNPQLSSTDGLIILKETDDSLVCDFYNKDGSEAEMCGNAACCISFYLEWLGLNIKSFQLGKKKVKPVSKGGIIIEKPINPIINCNQPFVFSFIDTGVPHGVIHYLKLNFENKTDLKKLAMQLRFQNIRSYQKGMNVSFYQTLSDHDQLKAITYERGIEDFTLACGTGALAVSLIHRDKYKLKSNQLLTVKMPGGTLKVKDGTHLKLFSQVKKGF